MVPLYTRCLSTAEYGSADIIISTAGLAMPLLLLVIQDAAMRFSIDKEYEPCMVLTCALWVFLRGMLICLLGLFLVRIFFNAYIPFSYSLYFFSLVFANGLYNILISFLRGVDQVQVLVEASIITTAASCALNILFLLIYYCGIDGYLLANFLGTFVAILWICFRVKIWHFLAVKSFSMELCCEMERFSSPLILNKIGWWINDLSDRYIILWFVGAASTGVYSVAYKIPIILTTCSDIFAQAWQLSAIKEFDPNDENGFISTMYDFYNFFLVFCCSIIIIFNIPLAKILYGNGFFIAWKYVPPLLIAVVFGGLSGFVGSLFLAIKATKNFSKATVVGAISNIVLNIILIPLVGVMGAAIATMISSIIIWSIRLFDLKQYVSFYIFWKKNLISYTLLLIQSGVSLYGFYWVSVFVQIAILLIIIVLNRYHLVCLIKKSVMLLYTMDC